MVETSVMAVTRCRNYRFGHATAPTRLMDAQISEQPVRWSPAERTEMRIACVGKVRPATVTLPQARWKERV
jgi:hypothetical protein